VRRLLEATMRVLPFERTQPARPATQLGYIRDGAFQMRNSRVLYFPRQFGLAEMAVVGSLAIDRAEQIQPLDDGGGPEVERAD